MPKHSAADKTTVFRPAALSGIKIAKSKSKSKLKSRVKAKPRKAVTSSRSLSKPKTKLRSTPMALRSSHALSKSKATKRLQKLKPALSMPLKAMKEKATNATAAKKKVMPKTTSMQPRETNRRKRARGTPVLFLVKDPDTHIQSGSSSSPSKGRKKPQEPSSQVVQCQGGRKHTQTHTQTQTQTLPRYVTTSPIPTDSRLTRRGIEFFCHLGQRKVPDLREKSFRPMMCLTGVSWNLCPAQDADGAEAQVPLTNRLPIIDFISTNEFEKMCVKSRRMAK
ncbi:GL16576 [Drosophila persimilis]|uniref:GL16576 n=1 Tax=Drosophila persimilis TaxID=7234 RepID=B4GWM6_DROPE|nr:GL16576 [Drosophila persimilis]